MLEHDISSLPVVGENGSVEGVVTAKDLLRYASEHGADGGARPLRTAPSQVVRFYQRCRSPEHIFYLCLGLRGSGDAGSS